MAIFEFKLPDLGEGVMEGELVKWHVKAGDSVKEDQVLAEVMTDKATVTVPAPKAGRVVKTHGNEGDMAKVHQLLVTLEVEGAAPAQAGGHAEASAPAAAPVAGGHVGGAPASASKVLATPVTRRMAREHGLDLASIAGTGPQGRVTKADVVAALEGGEKNVVAAPAEQKARPAAPAVSSGAADERVPLRGLRKKIAEKMVRSKFTAPHFAFVEEVDATELVALRARLNAQLAAAGESTKLNYLPFIIKATVAALKKFPHLNANFDEASQELVVRGEYNIGMAAATPDGLTVAVVKNADRLTLADLARETARLGAAARDRKLKMEELTGGTFTISSLGQSGGLFATPIINHPEVGILGVHRLKKRPAVVGDQVVVRDMMNLSLSCDHRVIDGSVAADFTYEIIKYLEKPDLLFLAMA
ncbi:MULTISPECIES: dihydrolipoamide acetyltransferase family protein [Myxococcus]|uniref:Dihydrolipoamide acetyltransferase component of pyruvate dehydrogenase complex n=1 Tax=Myxococcus virescens TaxID=83456 RepID=A0A511H4V5_9BACT|nr:MULTISPECIES: dihydrolipoamide acetyltransferase family protein [Myxococcus]WNZ58909.1 dihydrolipoamide acetyltransferase family protein [Myxococcus sp. MxC21-1]GEL68578.1 dihydrolipoamide acetyltransferase component of pyruvate dehydrogenase complex [Myxococcus virescens]SDE24615.1 pyruvate dehydrogenase E2 component (dihydrolipoamide acetyltransferase) [Myxococcus virescens]